MHWCRWPIAAAVAVGGYCAMAPDLSPLGRARWSCARVHQWLAADDSPVAAWRRAGRTPTVRIDLRTSPPLDTASTDALAATCIAGLAASDGATNGPRDTLVVPVHVGVSGVHAEIAVPDGSGAVLETMFPTHWLALAASVAGVIAVFAWPRRRAAG